jgi:6-pyruvoyl-tetrahydropterin synthase
MKRRISTAFATLALALAAFAIPASADAAPAVPAVPRVQQKAFTPTDLVTGVLKALVNTAGKKFGEKALKSEAFGWLLAAFGLEGLFAEEDQLEPIREQLSELTKEVKEIKSELKHGELNEQITATKPLTSRIDTSYRQLENLASLDPGEPTRVNLARRIAKEIGDNLITAPAEFKEILGSDSPLSTNLLKAASKVVHADHRFFDKQQSQEIRDVYEYYALYQAKLAVLLTEYFHTEPETYATKVIEAEVRQIEKNLADEEKSLKPVVPDNAVIDTKTGLMWLQAGRQAEKRPTMDAYIGVVGAGEKGATWQNGRIHYVHEEQANNASPWDVPWGGRWRLPTAKDFDTLISGHGDTPIIQWLAEEARFDPKYLQAADSKFWVNPADWGLSDNFVYYRFFNFRTGSLAGQELRYKPREWRDYFSKIGSVAIYDRRPGPDEHYWWG